MMLAATGGEDDVCAALAGYAEASGLSAVLSRDGGVITMAIG